MASSLPQPPKFYVPESLARQSLDALAASLERELQKIAAVSQIALAREVEVMHEEPVRPRQGMVRAADGSDWDPCSTAAPCVVWYDGAAWQLLG